MEPHLPLSNKNGIQKGQINFGRCGINILKFGKLSPNIVGAVD